MAVIGFTQSVSAKASESIKWTLIIKSTIPNKILRNGDLIAARRNLKAA